MPADIISTPNRGWTLLFPEFADKLRTAIADCQKLGYPVAAFELWRSPQRQDWLYAQGRTRVGKIVTKAKAWESAHQLGLAADLAFLEKGAWSWNGKWMEVVDIMEKHGLESLRPFETSHVQMMHGLDIKAAVALMRECGLQRVWLEVAGG